MKNDLSTDVDYLADRLSPLIREGKPVALQLFTPHAAGRRKDPLVIFTPGTLLGWPRERIAVAVINQGSAIITLETKREYNRNRKKNIEYQPKIADCVRAGIPAKLATVLVATMQQLLLLKEKKYARPTPHSTNRRTSSRSSTTPRRYTPFRSL